MNETAALVVDDSRSMRNYVASLLRDELNIDAVLEAENADHAITLLEANRDLKFSCIICDVNMPGKTVDDFISYVSQRLDITRTPVFLLTAENEHKISLLSHTTQVMGCLHKPFQGEDLISLIMPVIGYKERRRAKRITPCVTCTVELDCAGTVQTAAAEIINISITGILLRIRFDDLGLGTVYEVAAMALTHAQDDILHLYGEVVRIEADRDPISRQKFVKIALDFQRMNLDTHTRLESFIGRCDADGTPLDT